MCIRDRNSPVLLHNVGLRSISIGTVDLVDDCAFVTVFCFGVHVLSVFLSFVEYGELLYLLSSLSSQNVSF